MKRGRKPLLTYVEQIDIGGFCNEKWRELTIEKTMEKINVPEVKRLQNKLAVRAARGEVRFKYDIQCTTNEIDSALSKARRSRCVALSDWESRLYGERERVLQLAVMRCWRHLKKRVSPAYVQDCWDRFRKIERRLVSDRDSLTS